MKIVVVAATEMEVQPSLLALQNSSIPFCKTGVGMLATTFTLTKLIAANKPDLLIQAGIAGSFNESVALGKVMVVNKEFLGDLGVQEQGICKDVFDMGFTDGNEPPFEDKALPNQWLNQYNLLQLDEVAAITVNQITTHEQQITLLQEKYKPVLESMEGAALHYVCRQMDVPFLQLRAISNYVGERDKSIWQMKLATDNLNEALMNLINRL
jgi:futalosine hydrolase